MKYQKLAPVITACSVIMLVMLATGCQSESVRAVVNKEMRANPNSATLEQGTAFPESQAAMKEMSRLELCRKELEAMQNLNMTSPQEDYQGNFDTLMQEISRYSSLRNSAGDDTRETVDALYRYRVNRLCANVHLALLNGLSDRGEQMK